MCRDRNMMMQIRSLSYLSVDFLLSLKVLKGKLTFKLQEIYQRLKFNLSLLNLNLQLFFPAFLFSFKQNPKLRINHQRI